MHKRMLIAWVKDAHVMETLSLPILRKQIGDERHGAAARARREFHLGETELHAERMRQALETLGSVPSPLVHNVDSIRVLATDITSRLFSDPLVVNVIGDLAAEQFEVAAYSALIAAAEHAGEAEIARLCRLNRGEDEDMAEWLEAQIPIVLAQRLGQAATNNR